MLTSVTAGAVALLGGLFLSRPAQAAPAPEQTCRDSVREYCQWVADNYCAHGAICTYTIDNCQIVDAECY
jgi:hypothetical protein